MDWGDLKYVLATARSGSFLGAAHLLKVTHTTVGRRIKALEQDLGQPLFRRTRDGVEATALCHQILPAAEAIEAQVRQIALASEAREIEPAGQVRVHTAAWLIEHLLVPALPAFQDAYPKIQVFFVSDVVDSIVDASRPGISLRFDVMAKRNEVEADIADIPFSVYRARDADPTSLRWATTHGGPVKMRTSGWLEGQGVADSEVDIFATDAALVRAALATGHYQGLIPDYLGKLSGELERVGEGPPDLVRRLHSITPRRSLALAEVQTTLAWLTRTIKASAAVQPPPGSEA